MTGEMSGGSLRIFLLIKSLRQGGAQRQCCVLAAKLAEEGHSVRIIVFDQAELFYESILPKSVDIISLKCHRWNIPGLLSGLYRTARNFRPNILYGFMSQSNLLSIVVKPFIDAKVVCGVRASSLDLAKEPWSAGFGEWIHEIMLRFADLVITNSNTAKTDLVAKGLSEEHIAVIPNGIDTERFRFNPDIRAEIRGCLGYAEKDHVVGMFARLHPMKGHEFLLSAFSVAAENFPNLRLLLIGSGDRHVIEDWIKASSFESRIILLDERQGIEQYYSAIDLYCSSSLYGEGFPNSLAEAMASGLPCIATDVGDSRLIVAGCGTLVPPSDVRKMADAIQSHTEVSSSLGSEARREYIVRNFGLNLLGQRTIQVLRRVLES